MALAKSRKVSKGNNGTDHWSVTKFFDGEKWMEDFGDDDQEPRPVDSDNQEQ